MIKWNVQCFQTKDKAGWHRLPNDCLYPCEKCAMNHNIRRLLADLEEDDINNVRDVAGDGNMFRFFQLSATRQKLQSILIQFDPIYDDFEMHWVIDLLMLVEVLCVHSMSDMFRVSVNLHMHILTIVV